MTADHAPGREPSTRWRRAAKAVAVTALAVIVVCAGGAALSWWQERDLRALDALRRTDGEVTGTDFRRRLPDLVEVRFEADGRPVDAQIPGDLDHDEGDTVEVAYVPGEPQRVRLVDGWEPAYVAWLEYGVIGVVAAVFVGLRRGMVSGARRLGRAARG